MCIFTPNSQLLECCQSIHCCEGNLFQFIVLQISANFGIGHGSVHCWAEGNWSVNSQILEARQSIKDVFIQFSKSVVIQIPVAINALLLRIQAKPTVLMNPCCAHINTTGQTKLLHHNLQLLKWSESPKYVWWKFDQAVIIQEAGSEKEYNY